MPSPKKTALKARYEPILKLAALPYDQFFALKDNIDVNGVLAARILHIAEIMRFSAGRVVKIYPHICLFLGKARLVMYLADFGTVEGLSSVQMFLRKIHVYDFRSRGKIMHRLSSRNPKETTNGRPPCAQTRLENEW
jgi:hypothetical protein